ncbi:MAG TPA: class I SAM-dependent methyltransferase [Rubrivivax sp.]|nr:class I SAM-dependent methyltransferase [Rubrivivax sp.]
MSARTSLEKYAASGHRRVAGWLSQIAVDATCVLSRQQVSMGMRGGLAEIGVHHGRFFILLHLLREPGERSAAYDLFEMQSENVDRSGEGSKSALLANLQRHADGGADAITRSRNSLHMTPAEVLNDVGAVRLFSIDGGHTADITASDLSLAESAICSGGIVILDDYFNPSWPGVSEGTNRHFSQGSKLVPVCITGNKFVFTNTQEHAKAYRQALGTMQGAVSEFQEVFGARVLVLSPQQRSLKQSLAGSSLWRHMGPTRVGRLAKDVALRILER